MAKVTIRDVADRAGVSTTTVYKVLNHKGSISKEVTKRVLRAAEDLHYVPNQFAQGLARRTLQVVTIVPGNVDDYQRYVYAGIEEAFAKYNGMNIQNKILTYTYDNETEDLAANVKEVEKMDVVDAMIIQANMHGHEAFLQEMTKKGTILYFIGSYPDLELTEEIPFSVVRSNGRVMGKLAAQFLSLRLPPKSRVAILTPDLENHQHRECIRAFCESEYASAFRMLPVTEIRYREEKVYKALADLFAKEKEIDGIYLTSYIAPMVCRYLREHPYGRPIQMIGHDIYPALAECIERGELAATIFQNQKKHGELAVEGILRQINSPEPPSQIQVSPQLVLKSNLECYEY